MVRYAVIFKDGKTYKIAGGRLKAEKGHTVRFFNFADAEATVTFLKDSLFEEKSFSLEPGGGMKEWADIQPGYYPYTVMVGKHEATASRPIVIVYP